MTNSTALILYNRNRIPYADGLVINYALEVGDHARVHKIVFNLVCRSLLIPWGLHSDLYKQSYTSARASWNAYKWQVAKSRSAPSEPQYVVQNYRRTVAIDKDDMIEADQVNDPEVREKLREFARRRSAQL